MLSKRRRPALNQGLIKPILNKYIVFAGSNISLHFLKLDLTFRHNAMHILYYTVFFLEFTYQQSWALFLR